MPDTSVCSVAKGVQLFASSDLEEVGFFVDPARDMPWLGELFAGVSIIHRTNEQGQPTGVAFFARTADLRDIRPP